ncbi:purine-cytosine permease family protein [Allofustis seminis]|uniref:purine-cytosine permease family protein n=1 Tax=Allofustis seminis TaxID=166939 RepID=UPI00035EAAAD|nr:cytosine permease [Allofustis seminis]
MEKADNNQANEVRDYAIDEYVPMSARYYGAKEMTSTWICANANPTTWYMGTIMGALGLSGVIVTSLIGNPIVYFILTLVGLMGFKVASTNMGLCRVPFGIKGSKLPSFINALQFVGWCGVNTYIAATALSSLITSFIGGDAYNPILITISVAAIMLASTITAVYGAKYISKAQIIAVICLVVLSIWITIKILGLVSFDDLFSWSLSDNIQNAGWTLSFGGGLNIILANGFAWIMCVADYTRYTTSKKAATVAPMFGAAFGMLWFITIGAAGAIAVAVMNGGYFDPYSADLAYICSTLGMGMIANVLIVISTIAVNMINIYSGGFSTANISEKVPAKTSMISLGMLAAIIGLSPLVLGSFLDTFQVFLNYLGALFPPCIAIMVVDYYLIRKGNYDIKQFNVENGIYWYKNGVNYSAIFAWILGAASYFVIENVSFVNDTLGSVLFSFIATCVIYYVISIFRKDK